MTCVYGKISQQIDLNYKSTAVTSQRINCLIDSYVAVKIALSKSDKLKAILKGADLELEIYGSTVNSLAMMRDSDLDLTIIVEDFSLGHE